MSTLDLLELMSAYWICLSENFLLSSNQEDIKISTIDLLKFNVYKLEIVTEMPFPEHFS